jgi:hypothetical protein
VVTCGPWSLELVDLGRQVAYFVRGHNPATITQVGGGGGAPIRVQRVTRSAVRPRAQWKGFFRWIRTVRAQPDPPRTAADAVCQPASGHHRL